MITLELNLSLATDGYEKMKGVLMKKLRQPLSDEDSWRNEEADGESKLQSDQLLSELILVLLLPLSNCFSLNLLLT
jgi:hypothetical protein